MNNGCNVGVNSKTDKAKETKRAPPKKAIGSLEHKRQSKGSEMFLPYYIWPCLRRQCFTFELECRALCDIESQNTHDFGTSGW